MNGAAARTNAELRCPIKWYYGQAFSDSHAKTQGGYKGNIYRKRDLGRGKA